MLNLGQAKALAKECQGALVGKSLLHLFALDNRTWLFEFEQSKRLLVSLKRQEARFHLFSRTMKGPLSSWNALLAGAEVQECALVGGDRILELTFRKGGKLLFCLFELFSGRAYLFDQSERNDYRPPERPFAENEKPIPCTSKEIEELYSDEKDHLSRSLAKKLKRTQAAWERAQADLNEALTWKEREHEAELLKAHFHLLKRGMKEIALPDWESENAPRTLSLDPSLTPQGQVERFFKKARKLKKGVQHAERHLGKVQEALATWERAQQELESLTTPEELSQFVAKWKLEEEQRPKKGRPVPKPRLPYRSFTSAKGLSILVAKSAEDGDALTFTVANGSDYWLHVADYPGSHVVLQVKKGEEPDPDSLEDAAQLALHFSKIKKAGSGGVTVTQVKYVSKPRGAKAGLVNVSKHKTIACRKDEGRLKRLLGSPE